MTYVELIVVLSIFSIMSSIVIFNYGKFQQNLDIKNLSGDIALKVLQAQKFSISGKLPSITQQQLIADNGLGGINAWKPSYGIFFDILTPTTFTYFTDVNLNSIYDASWGEFNEIININNNMKILKIEAGGGSCSSPVEIEELTVVFKRPNSGAIITTVPSPLSCVEEYINITVSPTSDTTKTAIIKVYTSGRIEIR